MIGNNDILTEKSQDDWKKWLNEQLLITEDIYAKDPDRLISSYNREQGHIKDYHDRELLELIQNADDAGLDFSGKSKLEIKLSKNALYVANTGIPFSFEGIKSLMVSDISPKQSLGLKYIGYKGLGFRSILGWASSVAILSGNARVGFSRSGANKWLSNLIIKHENIRNRVKKHSTKSKKQMPVAVLDAPIWLNHDAKEKEFNNLVKQGNSFIENNYDTVVCISFFSDDIYDQIERQIKNIISETLIFLQNILELKVETSEYNKSWTVKRDEEVVKVTIDEKERKTWNLYTTDGEIPDELLDDDQTENKYGIKVAVPDHRSENPGRIFVYFPTKEEFPFSVIVHATFELSANRQRINPSPINQYISNELAHLMAVAATKIIRPNEPWYAVKSFVPRGHISGVLDDFKFLEKLQEHLIVEKIVPNIDCQFCTANDLYRLKGDFDKLLDKEIFSDIAMYSDDDLFEYLEIELLPQEDFVDRINKMSNSLSIENRAQFIYKYCNEYSSQETETLPDLLIDDSGNIIPGSTRTTFPAERQEFQLPEWVPVKILNSKLIEYLKELFDVERARDVRYNLNLFRVQEYNLTTIVQNIIAASNRRIKKHPANEAELGIELVSALWSLFCSMENPGNFQERITVPLPSRNGKVKAADELYFGKEYECGLLTDYLYKNIEEDVLLASPENVGFEETNDQIEVFLKWLGVSENPRVISITKLSNDDFINYVKSNLDDPVKFSDLAKTKEEILSEKNWCFSLENIQSIDHLEDILETSDHHAILTWIANSYEIERWRRAGDMVGEFCYTPSGHRRRRPLEQEIPSYPVWLIHSYPWMIANGSSEKIPPMTCTTAKIAKDLSPVIGYPAINTDHEIFKKYEIDKTAIITALVRSGVVSDFDELPWSTFYKILFNLPDIDPDAQKAKSLYRSLITRSNVEESPPNGQGYEEFMSEGRMAGMKDGVTEYYPIESLFYVDDNTIPDHIVEHYPIILLDRKKGHKKVKNLFGIEHLNTEAIQANITKHVLHPMNTQFNSDLDRLRPYVYSMRIDADSKHNELRRIRRLQILLCKSLKCTIVVNDKSVSISIRPGKSLQQGGVIYLVTDKDHQPKLLKDELLASAVGEIITNQFEKDIGSEIARILSCTSENRDSLLNEILGGDGEEYLNRAKRLFEAEEIEEEQEFDWSEELENVSGNGQFEDNEKSVGEDEVETSLEEDQEEIDPISGIIVKEVKHTPTQPSIRKIVVSRNPSVKSKPNIHTRADPDRAEELAFKFEEDQGRVPLLISQYRGEDSPGCDILSFNSAKDKEKFIDSVQKNINYSLVERFLEVKGRSSSTGSIILGGNELERAQDSREKYYLYRVYEPSKGEFELVELSDPLDEDEAKKLQYEINPFQSKKTKRWTVHEV